MTYTSLIPVLVLLFAGWRLYRRLQKAVREQQIRVKRLRITTIVLPLCFLLVGFSGQQHSLWEPLLLGGIFGIVLGAVSIKLTRFNCSGPDKTYTPNPYLGSALIILFLGRIVYRFWQLSLSPHMASPAALNQNPIGIALFGTLAGYYTFYSAGLLRHHQQTIARKQ